MEYTLPLCCTVTKPIKKTSHCSDMSTQLTRVGGGEVGRGGGGRVGGEVGWVGVGVVGEGRGWVVGGGGG